MKRIAIIGSSNSMLSYGYVNQMKNNCHYQIDLFSLGATGSIKSIYYLLNGLDINQYQNIIFDSSMNDTASLYGYAMNKETLVSYLSFICQYFVGRTCAPIFLILPTLWIEKAQSSAPIVEALCDIYGIRVINMEKYLSGYSQDELIASNDPNHFLLPIQVKIAELLFEELSKVSMPINDKINCDIKFDIFDSDKLSNFGKIINKNTSLVSFDLSYIPYQKNIFIPEDRYISGIVYWNEYEVYLIYKNNECEFWKNLTLPWDGAFARSIGYSFQNIPKGGFLLFSDVPSISFHENTYIENSNSPKGKNKFIGVNSLILSSQHPYLFGVKFIDLNRKKFIEYKKNHLLYC